MPAVGHRVTVTLVPLPGMPEPLAPGIGLGRAARLTRRNRLLIDARVHPATRQEIWAGTAQTCGTCRFAVRVQHGARNYWKCEKHRLGVSRSEYSDIRKCWPACALWQPDDEETP